jgi:hypothetical protein
MRACCCILYILIKVKINLLLTNEGLYKPIIAAPILTRGAIGEPKKDFAKRYDCLQSRCIIAEKRLMTKSM